MAQVVKGFKIEEELKSSIEQSIEASGLTQKDWLEHAHELMRAQSLKASHVTFAKDITELDGHVKRVYELYTNMIVQGEHLREESASTLKKKIELQERMLMELNEKLTQEIAKNELTMQEMDESIKEKEESAKIVEELKLSAATNQDLIVELKEKVTNYAERISQLSNLSVENADLNKQLTLLTKERDEAMAITEKVTAQVEEMKVNSSKEIKIAQENGERALRTMSEKAEFELEKALLRQDKEHQQALKDAQNEQNEMIKALYAKLDAKEEKHQLELKRLNEELAKTKESHSLGFKKVMEEHGQTQLELDELYMEISDEEE